jgi:hypothetical protein
MELPQLQGTEKQINWAETIRKNRIKAWQSCSAIYDAIEKDIYGKKLASWWIANKDKNAEEIYRFIQGGSSAKTSSPSKVVVNKLVLDEVIKYDGAERIETEYGYKTVFPTRRIDTGEIVNDESLPF